MVADFKSQKEKEQRLATLEEAERLAIERWSREIIYKYLTETRQVKHLVHFTPINNLWSIMQNGILSRNEIEKRGIRALTPDIMRLDSQMDYTSFSISFPNYQLFYNKRNTTEHQYVVLLIDPAIVLELPIDSISYLPDNAASKNVRNIKNYTGVEAAKSLFNYTTIDNRVDRRKLDIPLWYTTNPQAEVFIKGVVAPKHIKYIITKDTLTAEKLRRISFQWSTDGLPIIQNCSDYYSPRKDHRFWSANSSMEEME